MKGALTDPSVKTSSCHLFLRKREPLCHFVTFPLTGELPFRDGKKSIHQLSAIVSSAPLKGELASVRMTEGAVLHSALCVFNS